LGFQLRLLYSFLAFSRVAYISRQFHGRCSLLLRTFKRFGPRQRHEKHRLQASMASWPDLLCWLLPRTGIFRSGELGSNVVTSCWMFGADVIRARVLYGGFIRFVDADLFCWSLYLDMWAAMVCLVLVCGRCGFRIMEELPCMVV
jgi:hypothetical protein